MQRMNYGNILWRNTDFAKIVVMSVGSWPSRRRNRKYSTVSSQILLLFVKIINVNIVIFRTIRVWNPILCPDTIVNDVDLDRVTISPRENGRNNSISNGMHFPGYPVALTKLINFRRNCWKLSLDHWNTTSRKFARCDPQIDCPR